MRCSWKKIMYNERFRSVESRSKQFWMWRNSNSIIGGDGGSGARTRFHSIKAIECVEFFCYNKLKAILKTFGLNFFFFFFLCVSLSLSYKSHRNNQSFVVMLLVKLAKPTPLTALLLSLISPFSFFFCVSLLSSLGSGCFLSHTHSLTDLNSFTLLLKSKEKIISVYLLLCMNSNIRHHVTHAHAHTLKMSSILK